MSFTSFFNYPNLSTGERKEDVVFLPDRSDEDWAKLLEHIETRRFRAGEVVITRWRALTSR